MFRYRLKELRNDFQLTQEELGNEFNLSNTTISKYETGENEPDINMLIKLSDRFNVSIDYLVGKTNVKTPKYTLQELQYSTPNVIKKINDILIDFKSNNEYIELVHSLLNSIKKIK